MKHNNLYKKGDNVLIIKDLVVQKDSTKHGVIIAEGMVQYKGKYAYITKVCSISYNIDKGRFFWTDTMFKEIKKESSENLMDLI